MGRFGAAGGEIQGIEGDAGWKQALRGAKKEGCRLEAAALGEGWYLKQGKRCGSAVCSCVADAVVEVRSGERVKGGWAGTIQAADR